MPAASTMTGRELTARCLMIALSVILVLELVGFATRFLTPALFRQSAQFEDGLDKLSVSDFARFGDRAASVLGIWQPTPASIATIKDCRGNSHSATYGATGARAFDGYSDARAEVLLVGDSYTHGDEVGDEQTIAAHLSRASNIMAANLGVGGYSPLQAFLRAKQLSRDFPAAKVIVLGIMYENIRRNINSYIPAFASENSSVLGVRPFARDGQIHLVPKEAFEGLEEFKTYARRTFHDDFWAKPEAMFPNSLALLSMLSSQQYRIRAGGRVLKMLGRQYELDYRNAELSDSLAAVIRAFLDWSAEAQLNPLVIFVPQNKYDRQSPVVWLQRVDPGLRASGRILNADMTDVDWTHYNVKPSGDCHPSPYGYAKIAEFYATAIKNVAHVK